MDALVLKALALVLGEHLRPHLSDRVYHLAGTGGSKAAVRQVAAHLSHYQFVFRTDVKGYYASINHSILYGLVARHVEEPLDDQMAQLGCFYVRFMDDWVVLAPTRWKLRRAIRAVNQVMADLRVEQHPDKTFIGPIARGFDFLGYWFSSLGVGVAKKTVDRMMDKVSRLYEQGADLVRIETYVIRWCRWVRSGVGRVLAGGCPWSPLAPLLYTTRPLTLPDRIHAPHT